MNTYVVYAVIAACLFSMVQHAHATNNFGPVMFEPTLFGTEQLGTTRFGGFGGIGSVSRRRGARRRGAVSGRRGRGGFFFNDPNWDWIGCGNIQAQKAATFAANIFGVTALDACLEAHAWITSATPTWNGVRVIFHAYLQNSPYLKCCRAFVTFSGPVSNGINIPSGVTSGPAGIAGGPNFCV